MLNAEVKKEIKKMGFTLWQIAEQIGVSETFSNKMVTFRA